MYNATQKRRSRWLSMILCLAMLLSQLTFTASAASTWSFTDVPSSAWYRSSVEFCFQNGYMSGTSTTTFSPTKELNRGMMVTILWNMAGRPKASKTTNYPDITSTSAYYYQAVQWASANKVVSGFADGTFGPGKNITREQLACMLMNYARFSKMDTTKTADISHFADASKIGSYAVSAVKWAYANKIISGKNNGTAIDPKGNATRAEAASMIRSYCTNVKPVRTDKRVITISGLPENTFYTSDHKAISDDYDLWDDNDPIAKMKFDNMRAIEKKYNVELRIAKGNADMVSLYEGKPTADIYCLDEMSVLPLLSKGLILPVEKYALKSSDIFTTHKVVSTLRTGTQKEYMIIEGEIYPNGNGVYGLGFNLDMIEAAGLENPQDLYDRGEWTWDVFMWYLRTLTKDTDKDGKTDVYGYGGWWTQLLQLALMSNSADIAATTKQHLDDPKTVDVLNLINEMYNVQKVARPWDPDDWDINNSAYRDQKTAFWISATWVAAEGDEYLPFETGLVPFPLGPASTDRTIYQHNNYYGGFVIPVGTEDPELVYNVLYDWLNWYHGDTSVRDGGWDPEGWIRRVYDGLNSKAAPWSLNYLLKASEGEGAHDWWGNLGLDFSLTPLMNGEMTVKELVASQKVAIQDSLDAFYKNGQWVYGPHPQPDPAETPRDWSNLIKIDPKDEVEIRGFFEDYQKMGWSQGIWMESNTTEPKASGRKAYLGDVMKPGTVFTIYYDVEKTDTIYDYLWFVLQIPDRGFGWNRVCDAPNAAKRGVTLETAKGSPYLAARNNSHTMEQITYDQIMECLRTYYPDLDADSIDWQNDFWAVQCESGSNWRVTKVTYALNQY